MSPQLVELLDAARERSLTPPELDQLAELAEQTGKLVDVVGRLMMSGPRGVFNLRIAARLRAAHARLTATPVTTRRDAKAIRANDQQAMPHTQRAIFAPHAVERFIERIRPDLDLEAALVEMNALVETSMPMKERTMNGEEQWQSSGDATFIIRRDGDGRPPIVVTVLGKERFSLQATSVEGAARRRAKVGSRRRA